MSDPLRETRVREIDIRAEDEGQRIDNFLFTHLKGVPKSRIYRILRRGEVRVNRGRIRPDYRLQEGDRVRVPPLRMGEEKPAPRPSASLLNLIEGSILYEDSRILVLNKPAGVAVHGGSGISSGVIEVLRALRPDAPFLELVHRLDRDTSGCLVIAKRRSALRALHETLRGEGIDKRYLALVKGRWRGGMRRAEAPLRKNTLQSGERVVRVDPTGKPSLSLFRPVAIYSEASLMEVNIVTGRTHQVRVHAAHLGHPIAGDSKYGEAAFNQRMAAMGLKRLFLHASRLSFPLPGAERRLELVAPLPAELEAVLSRLEGERRE